MLLNFTPPPASNSVLKFSYELPRRTEHSGQAFVYWGSPDWNSAIPSTQSNMSRKRLPGIFLLFWRVQIPVLRWEVCSWEGSPQDSSVWCSRFCCHIILREPLVSLNASQCKKPKWTHCMFLPNRLSVQIMCCEGCGTESSGAGLHKFALGACSNYYCSFSMFSCCEFQIFFPWVKSS